MSTTPEAAFEAAATILRSALAAAVPGAVFIDDSLTGAGMALPDEGQVVITLADRGVAEGINGFGPFFRSMEVEIEALATGATAGVRRARVADLLHAVEAALNADRSLGGVAEDCDFEPLDPQRQAPPAADDIAAEKILLTIEIHTDTQI